MSKHTIEKIDDDYWKIDGIDIIYDNDFSFPGWRIAGKERFGGGMDFKEVLEKVMNETKSKKRLMPRGVE